MSSGIQASLLTGLAEDLARQHGSTGRTLNHAGIRARRGKLRQNIQKIYKSLADMPAEEIRELASIEWLLDNEYVIQEAFQQIKRDLPRRFYRQLPKVEHADLGVIARVESLVHATLEATQVPLDMSWLEQLTLAYQRHHVLEIGELWAQPALLRLVVLEKLADAGLQLAGAGERAADEDMAHGAIIAGCILTLTTIANYPWPECVERLSRVNTILMRDPAGAYASMDFETRDRYRNSVERIARQCKCPEWQVAESAIELADGAAEKAAQHVGYYLLDKSRRELQRHLGYPDTPLNKLADFFRRNGAAAYVTAILGSSAFLLGLELNWLWTRPSPNMALLLTILSIPPALMLCSGTLNWIILRCKSPQRLPKMDFMDGIDAAWPTVVAIPALLNSVDELEDIVASLETNYLGNSDPLLSYVLLTDFPDAPEPDLPGEDALLELASAAIHKLNESYGEDGRQPFSLMHRRRVWNESEGCWMGWERKRGKLEELNRFLLHGSEGTFTHFAGSHSSLTNIRFVICLDADTHLTRDSARRMVGTLAHPLNRPVFDSVSGRVQSGYTILQPRIEINPVGANATLFSRIFTGDVTFDLYTRAVSNVYQDITGQGIFVGKGIYDLEGFTRSLEGELPENSVLSHDLLEGAHGRAGLASDIVLFEGFPATLHTYIRRQHRWIRGDWQLFPWMGWRGVRVDAHRARFRARLLHRWTMFDNLARSLLQPCLLALLIAGWIVRPEQAWKWSMAVAVIPGLPIIFETLAALGPSRWRWGTIGSTFRGHAQTLGIEAARWGLFLIFLPYQALIAVDAIIRALYRLIFSRKHLLEWTSAAQVARLFGRQIGILTTYVQMAPAVIFALAAAAVVLLAGGQAIPTAALFVLAWLLSPLVTWAISQQRVAEVSEPTDEEVAALRLLARRTWHFFETFVNPENRWLPPDNIQQAPKFLIAQRTSPSNIGFAMLSTLAAYDFGYLGLSDLCTRLRNTFDTLQRMPMYRGHYLNWITTTDLRALEPRYVSTVDSGNFAGCLIALSEGLQALQTRIAPPTNLRLGILDTIASMQSLVERAKATGDCGDLSALQNLLWTFYEFFLNDSPTWWLRLPELENDAPKRIEIEFLKVLEEPGAHWSAEDISEFRGWINCFGREVHAARREHEQLAPWQALLATTPGRLEQLDETEPAWKELSAWLTAPKSLADVANAEREALPHLDRINDWLNNSETDSEEQAALEWCNQLRDKVSEATRQARLIIGDIEKMRAEMQQIVDAMDFSFLYDKGRELFHIGYNASSGELDNSYYDLLASEARLASFIAIAQRQVPARHWTHLGRPLTRVRGRRVLLSWSATLFEYLMPGLLMECPERTLMNQSARTAVDLAERYGRSNGIPWGISESGYYHFDHAGNYQYQAFGLPELGLSRSHDQRLVISPYASVLGLPFDLSAVVRNIRELRKLGMEDQFGMREAIDYGPSNDFRSGSRGQIVRSFMAHHQGMIMLSLDNALFGDLMVRRFHADPRIAGIKPLLFEATPHASQTITAHQFGTSLDTNLPGRDIARTWRPTAPEAINVISNGHLNTRITSHGGGGQYWNDIALTRWDPQTDDAIGGLCLNFNDLRTGTTWNLGGSPEERGELDIEFGPHMTSFLSRHQRLLTRMTVVVAADADVEIRTVQITNESDYARSLRVSFSGEPIMTKVAEFRRHPAFSRLFIESKFVAESGVLLFRRRPRSADQEKLYLGYALATRDAGEQDLYFTNDRKAFLGRRGDPQQPLAALGGAESDSEIAATPNPWMTIGAAVEIPARGSVQLTFLTSVATSQRTVLNSIASFQSLERVSWSMGQARAQTEYELQRAKFEPDDARTAMDILARILWPQFAGDSKWQALRNCRETLSTLWRHGISGDHPIVVVSIGKTDHLASAALLLRCHNYWSLRGIDIDLLFLDETSAGYSQPARDRLRNLIDQSQEHDRPFKGITAMIAVSELEPGEHANLIATATIYLPQGKDIAWLLRQRDRLAPMPPFVGAPSSALQYIETEPLQPPTDLQFFNGYGGFSKDGREYVMYQTADIVPPAPWANVLANPNFGCLTTSAGLDFTWLDNSSEYRLTQWHNDPVTEQSSEALYLRDEETADRWSPTPWPANDGLPYQVAHGAGYSRFEHISNGLEQRVVVFADPEESVKIVEVQLKNCLPRDRRLTLTYVAQWVLGNSRADNAGVLVPEMDTNSHALLIRNGFARNHADRVAFLASTSPPHGVTTDLREFLGSGRSWRDPAGLRAIGLSDTVAPTPENCGAYQVHVDIPEDSISTVYFILGAAENRAAALKLIDRFQDPAFIEERRTTLDEKWDRLLGRLQISTPDPALDLLINRWLPYQAISSRLWGRTGFYQPGGAFGFRDQLQDVLALLPIAPELAHEQILRAAAVQFQEGDVLHWWHTNPLRGVRTRCSDDLLWLPYAVATYLQATGDNDLLEQQVAWLDGAELTPDQHEHYAEFSASRHTASIYEHCCRAIDARLTVGAHGLPFIGVGDWNDGLSRVGTDGRGESLWMAWFMCFVFNHFIPICEQKGDSVRAQRYLNHSEQLAKNADENGWDGDWYLRGFYDDGDKLGSRESDECNIDLNAQTWAIISGAGNRHRSEQAMQAVRSELVDPEQRLIKLLTPPFEKTAKDPGYIKGYPPGMRENGGQYNHAAVWAIWAVAEMGDADTALEWARWLNPIRRSADQQAADHYWIEPYVMPGDISAGADNAGHGGWTWYSGSAAWYCRLVVEKLLGLKWSADGFSLAPCLPADWPEFSVQFRRRDTSYTLTVEQPGQIRNGEMEAGAGDMKVEDNFFAWADDGKHHEIIVRPKQITSPPLSAEIAAAPAPDPN